LAVDRLGEILLETLSRSALTFRLSTFEIKSEITLRILNSSDPCRLLLLLIEYAHGVARFPLHINSSGCDRRHLAVF